MEGKAAWIGRTSWGTCWKNLRLFHTRGLGSGYHHLCLLEGLCGGHMRKDKGRTGSSSVSELFAWKEETGKWDWVLCGFVQEEDGTRTSLSRDAPWCRGGRNLELVLPLLPGAALQGPFQSGADVWSFFRDQTLRFIKAGSPLTALRGVGANPGIIAFEKDFECSYQHFNVRNSHHIETQVLF